MNAFTKEDTNKIKGISIIFMLIHHCFLSPERYKGQEVIFKLLSEHRLNQIALSMKICVALFVFLSAYGITLSLKKLHRQYNYSPMEVSFVLIRRWTKMMGGFIFVFLALQLYSLAVGTGRYTYVYGSGIMSLFYCVLDMFGLAQLFHTPTFIATFWYMSLAQIIVFVMPVLIWVYKRFGGIVLTALSVLLSIMFPEPSSYAFFPVYIVCISFGIIVADNNLFVILKEYNPAKKKKVLGKTLKFLIFIFAITGTLYLRIKSLGTTLIPTFEAIIAFLLIAFFFEFVNKIPIAEKILNILGIYSMDIFLIHNFIRVSWYYDFTYSFKYPILIVFVLLIISLLVSIVLELIKKKIRWDKCISYIQEELISNYSLLNTKRS